MASFHTKTFQKHDDYMTPKNAWENIAHLLPKDKILWEAFYGDGTSGEHLKTLGFKVIHQEEDFFTTTPEYDYICSNPPFSKVKEILPHLVELDKPFVMIMPCSKLTTQYFAKLFAEHKDPIQIIVPRKRIQFIKLVDGKPIEGWKDACNFDCFYYCWKMNLPRDITWLK